MKLIQIIRKYLIIGLLIVMTIGCISHFFIFRFFIHNFTDSILYEHKELIVRYINSNGNITSYPTSMVKPSRIEERPIDNPDLYPEVIKDTLLYSGTTGNYRSYRQLYFPIYYKNHWHQICINQPTIKENNLLPIIFSSLLLLFILLLLFTYLISYYIKNKIWIPFYYNLQKLQNYDLKANTILNLTEHNIKEFDELNKVIMRMVRKINEDYENSRVFIEDASHEMQTPLSIIKSKLELLIQTDSLKWDEEQTKSIAAMSRAVSRLSRLNRSLLLLNKINNDQFKNKEIINITSLLENYLEDLKELIEVKKIILEFDLEQVSCEVDPSLAEILISNLLSNSIRHNIKDGHLRVRLTNQVLIIANSCIQPANSKNLFNRLVMQQSEESSGLGLNIVKSICNKNNFDISYEYLQPNLFQIKVVFPSYK